ncbi:hypothetical protein MTR67_043465, partial [Solanum verrucosum]
MLDKMHKLSIIAVLDPFSDNTHVQNIKHQLAMKQAVSNCNGKIWLFWMTDIDYVVLEEDEQQITCDIRHNALHNQFTITFVYAKCKDHLRRSLWDRILYNAADNNRPWCSVGFSGQKYTWSNNRGIHHRIWKRLDRALVNDSWLEKMPQTTITNLSSIGSDHCPLLLKMVAKEEEHTKYFKFVNCWANHPNFFDMVKSCWERKVEGNNMWRFHQKLKRLSNTLSTWSRGKFGDIFMKVKEYEEKSIFTGENKLINEGAMDCIPRMVNQEQNNNLTVVPTIEELKEVVFSMNPNSAAGPDGMNGKPTDSNIGYNAVIMSDSEGQLQMNTKGQLAGSSVEQEQAKKDQSSEPAPYTVIQTMAARLRHIQAQHETPIELVPPKITSKKRLPAIIYDMDDFMTKLAVDWLPWHCFKKEFITPLLSPIGKVLYLDTTSIKRTRASMAKVKVQVDLTKARPRNVWIGLDSEDLTIGRWQTIEYENIPPYCDYCKHQGHMIYECNFKSRDEEFKKRKELEVDKKDKNKGENGRREMTTNRPRNKKMMGNKTKVTGKLATKDNLYNKRKKNGKHKKEKPTSNRRKKLRKQFGDQPHHKIGGQFSKQ